jgi:hypothetical protein
VGVSYTYESDVVCAINTAAARSSFRSLKWA